jgi:glucose-6-phosphate isomerase
MPLAYAPAVALTNRLLADHVVTRIWSGDPTVWQASPGSADERSIQTRLGWLHVAPTIRDGVPRAGALARELVSDGYRAAYLLGMGGSSLCAEVMRVVCGVAPDHLALHVLDTTDEHSITHANATLDPARALFLVASKSGGTVEVASLEQYFWARVSESQGGHAGRHFVAVTDPGTALQRLAESKRYRSVFLNPADIGGRFSALSMFGIVPGALIGADPNVFLGSIATMDDCRRESADNVGLMLGAFIGAAALDGRDKLTLALPPSLASLGLWIEQLVAESTGKHGKGALPVVDEPLGHPDEYGADRAFVAIATDKDAPDEARLAALEAAGHPVLRLTTTAGALGSEFFRWEFATAVAGAALGINPFDEPNVSEAKHKTKALLEAFAATGALPAAVPAASVNGLSAFSPTCTGSSPAAVVRAALASLGARDYVAFLSYLPASNEVESAIGAIRQRIRRQHRVATTFGIGPRYLHSTGQYHKGGPNTALAFVITCDDSTQTEIPGAGYTFATLKQAQALGDAETLAAHRRRVVRLHLGAGRTIADVEAVFAEALR